MAYLGILIVCCIHSILGSVQAGDYQDPHCGGRQVIVHLFQWSWKDIARECSDYLGPMGFCGVQVTPPNEHIIETKSAKRPWWERYRAVSYKLTSRSGNETEFQDMVSACKKASVRIYVEVELSHMTASKGGGVGTAGSSYDSDGFRFPGVPYTIHNKKQKVDCPDYNNAPRQLRDCYDSGFDDLNLYQTIVQTKISEYFNTLIDIGVAGFKVNGAIHLWPSTIRSIQSKTKDLPEGGRPFFYLEIDHQNDKRGAVTNSEYFGIGYIADTRYGEHIKKAIDNMSNLEQISSSMSDLPSGYAMVSVDTYRQQRYNRDVLTFKQPDAYKRAVAFTLAYSYGFPKLTSSYFFSSDDQGPPQHEDDTIKSVTVDRLGQCGNGWVCEHRWNTIGKMALFRNDVAGETVNNFRYENGVLSFNRGNKGFFAMAKHGFQADIYTGLPAGEYCDLISDCDKKITVGTGGVANISPSSSGDPFVAIVTRNDTAWNQTAGKDAVVPEYPEPDYRRTIILIEKKTNDGEDLFIRGGVDISKRQGCPEGVTSSPCSIPIRHINPGNNAHFNKVKAWSKGDNYLDWNGAEVGQGTYNGQRADGTPAYWSTTDTNHPGYNPLNEYGPHYWLVEVDMDCSRASLNGYFEFKVFINGQWEQNVGWGTSECTGDSGGIPPFSSTKNHIARCGYLNIFHFGLQSCEIKEFGLQDPQVI